MTQIYADLASVLVDASTIVAICSRESGAVAILNRDCFGTVPMTERAGHWKLAVAEDFGDFVASFQFARSATPLTIGDGSVDALLTAWRVAPITEADYDWVEDDGS